MMRILLLLLLVAVPAGAQQPADWRTAAPLLPLTRAGVPAATASRATRPKPSTREGIRHSAARVRSRRSSAGSTV